MTKKLSPLAALAARRKSLTDKPELAPDKTNKRISHTDISPFQFWCLVVGCWGLSQIPVIARPFKLIAVWAHELGHGLGAIAAGGRLDNLIITKDFGGVATSIVSNDFQHVVTIMAGLLGPSILGSALLILVRRFGQARAALTLLSIALAGSGVLWGGNAFTILTLLGLSFAIGGLTWFGGHVIRLFLAHILAILLCIDAVVRLDYFFVRSGNVAGGAYASDTGQLAQILGGSHLIWGTLLSALALLILWGAFRFSRSL